MIMAGNKKKIIRVTTVPMSLKAFCDGMLKELSEKYEVVAVSSPGEDLDLVAEREGVRTIAVPMERHISLWKDMKSLWQMTKVLKKEKPDMVHSMTPKAGLVTMVAGWLTGVPVRVHTFTGLVWPTSTGLKRRILMLTDKILCTCATHVIPEGQGVMDDLRSGGVTNKPMKVLGYGNVKGVDMDYWQITPDVKAAGEKIREGLWLSPKKDGERLFTFMFVGRLVGDKGINELVEAFIKLREYFLQKNNGQKVRLLLVGPTEDNLDPLKQTTWERIKSTPSIVEVGPVWGEDILNYYAASDGFVFPSYREGFPNTVMEAGAMGLASIVTDINGAREIVVSSNSDFNASEGNMRICDNGIIIPSKNAEAIYEAMKLMIEDDDMRERMAGKARKMIGDRFEKSFVRKCLYDFYDEILK